MRYMQPHGGFAVHRCAQRHTTRLHIEAGHPVGRRNIFRGRGHRIVCTAGGMGLDICLILSFKLALVSSSCGGGQLEYAARAVQASWAILFLHLLVFEILIVGAISRTWNTRKGMKIRAAEP